MLADITEQKRTEQLLRLTQYSIEHAVDALFWVREDASFRYVNEAACRSLGYPREDLLQLAMPDIDPQVTREIWPERWAEFKVGPAQCFESRHRTRDGREFPVEITAFYLEFADEALVCTFVRDTTARAALQAELRQLSQAVEQTDESIVITDREARIVYVNPAYIRASGFQREEVIGRNPRLLNSGRTPRATYESLWAALSQGHSWQGEFINRRKDGSEFIEWASISPLRQPDGRITHYVAVKQDITARKRAEAELEQAKQQALAAS